MRTSRRPGRHVRREPAARGHRLPGHRTAAGYARRADERRVCVSRDEGGGLDQSRGAPPPARWNRCRSGVPASAGPRGQVGQSAPARDARQPAWRHSSGSIRRSATLRAATAGIYRKLALITPNAASPASPGPATAAIDSRPISHASSIAPRAPAPRPVVSTSREDSQGQAGLRLGAARSGSAELRCRGPDFPMERKPSRRTAFSRGVPGSLLPGGG